MHICSLIFCYRSKTFPLRSPLMGIPVRYLYGDFTILVSWKGNGHLRLLGRDPQTEFLWISLSQVSCSYLIRKQFFYNLPWLGLRRLLPRTQSFSKGAFAHGQLQVIVAEGGTRGGPPMPPPYCCPSSTSFFKLAFLKHLLCASLMLNIFHASSATPRGQMYQPHFTDEDTEA